MRQLPETISPDGLLVGWSLELGRRTPKVGFETAGADAPPTSTTLEPILDQGDGHLITIASTGAGKGVGCIVPALLRYQGPVVVVDPKGENYAITARRRREMGQKVVVFDPFSITDSPDRHSFNPLDLIDPNSDRFVEDVQTLAHLASTNPGDRAQHQDPFWPQMGRTLVTAALMDVLTMPDSEEATLPAARRLINMPLSELAERASEWRTGPNQELRRMAGLLQHDASSTLSGYWAMAVNHLDFAKGAELEAHLSASDLDLNDVLNGVPMTLYLVLPPDKLESHAALLRLWVGALMSVITRRRHQPERPTLFLIDEAAQLGELNELRQAITLLRGYGVRIWSFWQDLSQLKGLYPTTWETILNNCRVQQFFGAVSGVACEAVAQVSGFGDKRSILELDHDEMVLNIAGDEPVVVRRPNYRLDPAFQGLFDDNPFYAERATPDGEGRAHRPVFERTVAPKVAAAKETRRKLTRLTQALFNPERLEAWEAVPERDRPELLKKLGFNPDGADAVKGLQIKRRALSYYDEAWLVEIMDTDHTPPHRSLALYNAKADRYAYLSRVENGFNILNREEPPSLRPAAALAYLKDYCAFSIAEEGRFFVVSEAADLAWSREDPDEDVLAAIDAHIAPPTLIEEREDHFVIAAHVQYGRKLHHCRFEVFETGAVIMQDDEVLFEDLDLITDQFTLKYLGHFNQRGEFAPIRKPDP